MDRIAEPWGTRTPYPRGGQWPIRVDTFLEPRVEPEDVDRWVQSASILHSNGDGIDIAVKAGRLAGWRGLREERGNRGGVGPKDLFGWPANGSPGPPARPPIRLDGEPGGTGWDAA